MEETPAATGRNVQDLGLCLVEEACRTHGHRTARASIARSSTDASVVQEICLDCTEAAGRLEGLRLWHSVCPCCFSSAFPDGLPNLPRTHAASVHPSHHH